MFCRNCGAEVRDSAVFCNGCGVRVSSEPVVEQQPADYGMGGSPAMVGMQAAPYPAGVKAPGRKSKLVALVAAVIVVLGVGAATTLLFVSVFGSGGAGGSNSYVSSRYDDERDTSSRSEPRAPRGDSGAAVATPALPVPVESPASSAPVPPSAPPEPAPLPVDEGVRYADWLDVIIDGSIMTLDLLEPAANSTVANWCFTMTHDRLLAYEGEGWYEPCLAVAWETSDFQTYNFRLRDDVFFHNGEKFTAHDVVYTWSIAREAVGSGAFDRWSPVEYAAALSDYEVTLVLGGVNVDFLFELTMPSASILKQGAYGWDDYCGTGAYRVVDFVPYSHVVLERNDNYWGEAPITWTQIWRSVPESYARTIMMQNGESQLCFGIPPEDLVLFQYDSDFFSIFPLLINSPQSIAFNMNDPVTGDYYFRMAVLHAMDKDEIAVVAGGDWFVSGYSSGTFWGLQTDFRNDNIPPIRCDPDRAREYLALSGYNGESVGIVAATNANLIAAEVLQYQLSMVGIISYIEYYDLPGFMAVWQSGDAQISLHNNYFTQSAASTMQSFVTGGFQNRAFYDRPEVTALFDEAAVTVDLNTRRDIYMLIQEFIAEDVPYSSMYWRISGVVGRNGVGGVVLPSDIVNTDLRYAYWILDD